MSIYRIVEADIDIFCTCCKLLSESSTVVPPAGNLPRFKERRVLDVATKPRCQRPAGLIETEDPRTQA